MCRFGVYKCLKNMYNFLNIFSCCFPSMSVSYYCDEITEDSRSEGIHQVLSKRKCLISESSTPN